MLLPPISIVKVATMAIAVTVAIPATVATVATVRISFWLEPISLILGKVSGDVNDTTSRLAFATKQMLVVSCFLFCN